MGSAWRTVWRITVPMAAAALLYATAVAATVWSAGTRDDGRNADVIVVMGAAQYDGRPSPLLEARLRHAVELWRDSRAPLIAVTGGKQPGDRFTEGEASAAWLVDNGVPADVIVVEETGRSTWESLDALAPILRENAVTDVVMVTSDWHAARSALTLEDMGFVVSTSGVAGPGGSLQSWVKEVLGVGFGRVAGFDVLYDITG
jgi:uncharacterized SAM-binding protein YcdF (DUF218 family)